MIALLCLKNIAERRGWVNRYGLRPQTGAVTKKNRVYGNLQKKQAYKNSVTGFAGPTDDAILPPTSVELHSEKEHLIWSQFTRARAKSD